MKTIYFDNAATTPVDSEVVKSMIPFLGKFYGNASSLHHKGQEAKIALEKSRRIIADSIGAKLEEIYFTSGGTEANNLAIKGVAFNKKSGHIITTKIEHDSVINVCKYLETKGFRVTYLDVDNEGFVNIDELKDSIKNDTIIVSVIHGNNEIGTIQNISEIGKICRSKSVLFHTDACQSYMKSELNVIKQNLDFVTLNAHKIHGPKGVGALFIRKGIAVEPQMHGGGHESGIRSGTENISSIVGFAKSIELAKKQDLAKIKEMRDKLIGEILKIDNVKLNGPEENRLCNNANFSFKFVEGESVGTYLDLKGICVSTGSACSSKSLKASRVLRAIGLSDEEAHGSLRFSLSRLNTMNEINYAIKVLPDIIKKLRKISPIGKEVKHERTML